MASAVALSKSPLLNPSTSFFAGIRSRMLMSMCFRGSWTMMPWVLGSFAACSSFAAASSGVILEISTAMPMSVP